MPMLIIRFLGLICALFDAYINYKDENKSAVFGWLVASLLWVNLILYSFE